MALKLKLGVYLFCIVRLSHVKDVNKQQQQQQKQRQTNEATS